MKYKANRCPVCGADVECRHMTGELGKYVETAEMVGICVECGGRVMRMSDGSMSCARCSEVQ